MALVPRTRPRLLPPERDALESCTLPSSQRSIVTVLWARAHEFPHRAEIPTHTNAKAERSKHRFVLLPFNFSLFTFFSGPRADGSAAGIPGRCIRHADGSGGC